MSASMSDEIAAAPDSRRSGLRVLILSSTLPRWEGDPEPRFVLDLARAITPHCTPLILAPMSPGAAAEEIMEGVPVRRFRYAPLRRLEQLAAPGAILPNVRARPWLALLIPAFFLGQLVALMRLLRRQPFDVVHCHWIVPQGLTMAISSFLMRTPPFLLTCHGTDVYALNSRWLRVLKRGVLRRASSVTVVSRQIGSFLNAHVDGRLAERCRHIPMGVDLALFHGADRGSSGAEMRVLYAGRLTENKGVDYLLRAMARSDMPDDARLRIVGDGPLRAALQEAAVRLGISSRVHFLGSLPHRRLADEMARATVFCLPSVVDRAGAREGMPTVLLEAAAACLPIVASDVGGCGDFIVSGETGWLIPPGDEAAIATALRAAIEDPQMASRMAVGAYGRVQQYSWDRTGARYAEELEAVASAGRHGDRAL